MAKKKEWRVLPEYDGKVTLEQEETGVLLSNALPQDKLAELARTPLASGFMKQVAINPTNNVTDEN